MITTTITTTTTTAAHNTGKRSKQLPNIGTHFWVGEGVLSAALKWGGGGPYCQPLSTCRGWGRYPPATCCLLAGRVVPSCSFHPSYRAHRGGGGRGGSGCSCIPSYREGGGDYTKLSSLIYQYKYLPQSTSIKG